MTDRQDMISKNKYLWLAFIWTASWVVVGYLLFREYREIDGVIGIIKEVKEGNYSIVILLGLSIVFLAQSLRNFFLYFSAKEDAL